MKWGGGMEWGDRVGRRDGVGRSVEILCVSVAHVCSVCHAVTMSLLDRLVWGLYNKGHLYVSINLQIRERLEANPVKAVALHAVASAWSLVCLVVVCKSASAYLLHIMNH